MQRIFSTFPNGWPGFGLLLLRVSCGVPLLCMGTDTSTALRLVGALTATLLIAGLWTPVAASCQVVLQTMLAFGGDTFASTHLTFALQGVSLVMLGPGAWSIDARIYGRKRIELGRS